MNHIHLKFPRKAERTYGALLAIYEHGPQSYEQIAQRFPNFSGSSFRMMTSQYQMPLMEGSQHGKSIYGLPEYLKKWFDDGAPSPQKTKEERVQELGPIVPARTYQKPSVMQGYAASLTRNLRVPIRDISFISASPSASVYWSE